MSTAREQYALAVPAAPTIGEATSLDRLSREDGDPRSDIPPLATAATATASVPGGVPPNTTALPPAQPQPSVGQDGITVVAPKDSPCPYATLGGERSPTAKRRIGSERLEPSVASVATPTQMISTEGQSTVDRVMEMSGETDFSPGVWNGGSDRMPSELSPQLAASSSPAGGHLAVPGHNLGGAGALEASPAPSRVQPPAFGTGTNLAFQELPAARELWGEAGPRRNDWTAGAQNVTPKALAERFTAGPKGMVLYIGRFAGPSVKNGEKLCPVCGMTIPEEVLWIDHVLTEQHLRTPENGYSLSVRSRFYVCCLCKALVSKNCLSRHVRGKKHRDRHAKGRRCGIDGCETLLPTEHAEALHRVVCHDERDGCLLSLPRWMLTD